MSSRSTRSPKPPDPVTKSEAHAVATRSEEPELVTPSASHVAASFAEQPDLISRATAAALEAASDDLARTSRYVAVRLCVGREERRYALPSGERSLIIGSSNGAHVVIDAPNAAPRHVELRVVDAHVVRVRDLDSEFGTWINFGDSRRPLKIFDAELQPGTEFEIGGVVLRFVEVECSFAGRP